MLPAEVVPPSLELCDNGLVRMAPDGFVRLILYRSPFSGEREQLLSPVGTSLREMLEDCVGRPLDPEKDKVNIVVGDRVLPFSEISSYCPVSGECVIVKLVPGFGTEWLIAAAVLTVVSLSLSIAGMVTGNPILGYIGMGVGVLALAAGGIASAVGTAGAGANSVGIVSNAAGASAGTTVSQAAGYLALGGGLAQGIVGMAGALTQGQPGIPSTKGVESSAFLKGVGNRAAQWEPIPSVFGKVRFAPPLGGQQVGEVASDGRMWVRANFVAGYGPCEILAENIKIGETLISNYEDDSYEIEVREGFQDDTDTTLYPSGIKGQEVSAVLVKGESTYQSYRDSEVELSTRTGRLYENAAAGATSIKLGFNDDRHLGDEREYNLEKITFKGWDNLIMANKAVYGWGKKRKTEASTSNTVKVGNPGNHTVGEFVVTKAGKKKTGYYYHGSTVSEINDDVLTLTDAFPSSAHQPGDKGKILSSFDWDFTDHDGGIVEAGQTICVQLNDMSWQEVVVATVSGFQINDFVNIWGNDSVIEDVYRVVTFTPPLEQAADLKKGVIRFGLHWETRTTEKETVEASLELHNPTGTVTIDGDGDRKAKSNELSVWMRATDPGTSDSEPGRWLCVSAAGDVGVDNAILHIDTDRGPYQTSRTNWGVVPGLSNYDADSVEWNAVNGDRTIPDLKGTGSRHYGVFGLATSRAVIWGGEKFRGTFASFTVKDLDPGQYDFRVAVTNTTWDLKTGRGDVNWTGLQSKSESPTSLTAVKMSEVAVNLKSTDERSGTIGDLKVLAERLLPFYEKGSGSNNGDWIEPPSRSARTTVKTQSTNSTTLECNLSDSVTIVGAISRNAKRFAVSEFGRLRQGELVSFSDSAAGTLYSESFTSGTGKFNDATAKNITLSNVSSSLECTVIDEGNVGDPNLRTNWLHREVGRSIKGSDFTQVHVWIKQVNIDAGASWQGRLYWKTTVDDEFRGSGDANQYLQGDQFLDIPEPTWPGSGYVQVTWDLSEAPNDVRPQGNPKSTWLDRRIKELRFDFFKDTVLGNSWQIDKIEITGQPQYQVRKLETEYEDNVPKYWVHVVGAMYTGIADASSCSPWLADGTGATSSSLDRGARQIGRDPKDNAKTMPHYVTVGTRSGDPEIYLPFRNDVHSFAANQSTATAKTDHVHVQLTGSVNYPQLQGNDGASTFPAEPSVNLTHASFSVRCPRPMDSPGGGYFPLFYCYDDTSSNATNFNGNVISGSLDDINDQTFTDLTFHLSPNVGNAADWGVGNLSVITIRPIYLNDNADKEEWGWFDIKDFKMWKETKVISSTFNGNTATYTLKDPIAANVGDSVVVDYAKFKSSSPAWACAEVLRGSAQPRPIEDASLDSDSFADWAEYCAGNEHGSGNPVPLKFDSLLDFRGTTLEIVNRISGSARGSLRAFDGRLGFLYDRDRSSESPVAMFTPRNSQKMSYKSAFNFVDLPHAWRVRYNDEEGASGEHIIYRDGYNKYGTGTYGSPAVANQQATRYEVLQTWGITDPDAVVEYARYQLANATYRRERVSIGVDLEHALVERGDLVVLAHDTDFSGTGFSRITMLNAGDVRDFSVSGAITRSTVNATESRYSVDVLDGGKTLCLTGNSWTYDTRLITIPANARIQFDYRAENYLPEISGIGYSTSLSSGITWFQLAGTQTASTQTYRSMYDGASGVSVAKINNPGDPGGYSAGDTVIEVDSTTGFVVGDPVVIEPVTGATGGQYWESTLSAVGATSLTLSSAIGSGIAVADGTSVTTTKVRTGEWVSYEIPFPAGDYYIGFVHDHDVNAEPTAKSYFRNVRVSGSVASVELDEPITLTEGSTGYKAKIRQAYTTEHFVEYDITNTNTTGLSGNDKQTTTLTFTTPPEFSTAPSPGDLVVFGSTALVGRRMLVDEVQPSSDMGAGISLVPEAQEIWTALANSETTVPAVEPIQTHFPEHTVPKKPRLDSISIKTNSSGTDELAISISPSFFDTVALSHFEVEWKKKESTSWVSQIAMASTGPREVRFPMDGENRAEDRGINPTEVQVRARSHRAGQSHLHSDWEKSQAILVGDLRNAGLFDYVVLALELSGSGNNFEFFSSSPKIEWKIGEIPEVENHLLYGNDNNVNTDWWTQGQNTHYPVGIPGVSVPCEVVVSYAPAGVASKVLRVENIAEASYVYSLDKNLADGGPYRDLEFKVTPVTGVERGSSQTIFVTNPAHPLPLVKSISQDALGLVLDFDDNFRQEADLENLIVWGSVDSGFTPGDANQIYSGRFTKRLRLPPLTPVTWYFRTAATDTFYRDSDGTAGLELSSETSVRLYPSTRYEDTMIGEIGNIFPDPIFNYVGSVSAIELNDVINTYTTSQDGELSFGFAGYPLGHVGWAVRSAENSITPAAGKYMLAFDTTGYGQPSNSTANLEGTAMECPKFETGPRGPLDWYFGAANSDYKDDLQLHPAAPGDVFTFSLQANRSPNSDGNRAGIEYPCTSECFSMDIRFFDDGFTPITTTKTDISHSEFPKETWTTFTKEATAPAGTAYTTCQLLLDDDFIVALYGWNSTTETADPAQMYFDIFDYRRASEAKHLAASAVTTAKLADSTGSSDGVTTAKLAANAVTIRSQDLLTASRSAVYGTHDIGTASMLFLQRKVSEITVDAGSVGGIAKAEWTGTTARTTAGNCKPTFRIVERGVTTTLTSADTNTTKIYFYVDSADGFAVGDLIGIDVDSLDASGGAGPGTTASDGGGSVFIVRELDLVTNTLNPTVKLLRVTVPVYWSTAAGGEVFQILSDIVPHTTGETYDSASYPVAQRFQFSATDITPRTGSRTFVFLMGNTASSFLHDSRIDEGSAATVEIVKK